MERERFVGLDYVNRDGRFRSGGSGLHPWRSSFQGAVHLYSLEDSIISLEGDPWEIIAVLPSRCE